MNSPKGSLWWVWSKCPFFSGSGQDGVLGMNGMAGSQCLPSQVRTKPHTQSSRLACKPLYQLIKRDSLPQHRPISAAAHMGTLGLHQDSNLGQHEAAPGTMTQVRWGHLASQEAPNLT